MNVVIPSWSSIVNPHPEILSKGFDEGIFAAGLDFVVDYESGKKNALPDNSYDLITCFGLFEYLQPPKNQEATDELLRVLKPDGKIVICYATDTWPARLIGYLWGFVPDPNVLRDLQNVSVRPTGLPETSMKNMFLNEWLNSFRRIYELLRAA